LTDYTTGGMLEDEWDISDERRSKQVRAGRRNDAF